MRRFRTVVTVLALLALQTHALVTPAGHAAPEGGAMAAMAAMADGHMMGDCCPGGHQDPTPCDPADDSQGCASCPLGFSCQPAQLFLPQTFLSLAAVPIVPARFKDTPDRLALQPPELLLRPPRIV